MSTTKPYFINNESPTRLRKLLIRNPFLPTLYDNLRTGRKLNDSIYGLDDDDPLIDFILAQLAGFSLIEQTPDGFKVSYSRLVTPLQWNVEEHHSYIGNVLSYTQSVIEKGPQRKVQLGVYTGSMSETDFMSHAEEMANLNNSLINKPDGEIKFQVITLIKQL